MKRYFYIFSRITIQNLVREMEFRSNFFLLLFTQMFWTVLQLVLVEVAFQFTGNIVGWTKYEIIALIGFYRIAKGFFDIFFYPNVMYLPDSVNRGELDYVLTRPINSFFLTVTRRQFLENISPVLAGLGILVYAIKASHLSFGPLTFLLLLS